MECYQVLGKEEQDRKKKCMGSFPPTATTVQAAWPSHALLMMLSAWQLVFKTLTIWRSKEDALGFKLCSGKILEAPWPPQWPQWEQGEQFQFPQTIIIHDACIQGEKKNTSLGLCLTS